MPSMTRSCASLLLTLPLLSACAASLKLEPKLPAPTPLEAPASFVAGVSEVDITAPPGLPRAGYSENARTGKGFRTRIYVRAFFLQAPGSEPLLIVQTDLLSGSSVLQRQLAEALGPSLGVQLHNITITATHTHGAPGNFLGSNFYNRFASNRAGFEPTWSKFVLDRMVEASQEAFRTRRPARMASGSIDVWGLTRNRSLPAWLRNANVVDKRETAERKYEAIQPALYLVRIDGQDQDGQYKPLGVLSSFSIHGTAVPQSDELYNGDVWSYASQVVEQGLAQKQPASWQPVAGLFEGTHGDMAPNVTPRLAGYQEAQRLGEALGQHMLGLAERLGGELRADVTLRAGFREVDLWKNPQIEDVTLCSKPYVGGALIGGAYENTTPVLHRFPPFAPGFPRLAIYSGCHKQKRVVASRLLQPLIVPTRDFPHVLPLQVLQLNDLLLAAFPFELTFETGKRLQAAVQTGWQRGGQQVKHVLVASVSNEYYGYATTPEEYSRQNYEGGHTLYGPSTTPFLVAHAEKLSRELAAQSSVKDWQANRVFTLKTLSAWPEPTQGAVSRQELESPWMVDPRIHAEGYWAFRWQDLPPDRIQMHLPLVEVQAEQPDGSWKTLELDGQRINDQSGRMSVQQLSHPSDGVGAYEARWYAPRHTGGTQNLRFRVAPREGLGAFVSSTFR